MDSARASPRDAAAPVIRLQDFCGWPDSFVALFWLRVYEQQFEESVLMKMQPKAFLPYLVFALILLRAPSAFADAKSEEPKRPWTILLYGAVDNSADDPFVDFTDKVRRAIDDDPGIELVLFIDRSKKHAKRATFLGDDFDSSRLYRVRRDSVERLSGGAHIPEITKDSDVNLNSADASTLQRFIAWGKANYPAKRYGLLIYSHADGKSMCPDERTGSHMGIAALTDKIGASDRVDFLALELCNMGGIEIAYQWRPGNGGFEAEVLLAIPNAGPPLDWDRAFRRIRSPGHAAAGESVLDPAKMTAVDFGRLVIEEGRRGRQAFEKPGGLGSKESAGCYDLRQAGYVKKAVDKLAVALAKSESKAAFLEVRNPSAQDRPICYSSDSSYVDLYDLGRRLAACDRLPESVRFAAADVMTSVQGFVIASFGMSGYKQFEAGKNGVFIVLPSGRPNCWKHYRWYTPARGDRENYGNWAFLRDGATPGNGIVENWFELLESWFNVPEETGRKNAGPDASHELEKLQGEWTLVAREMRGEKSKDEAVKQFKLMIKGNQWTVASSQSPQRAIMMTIQIDPSRDPKAIDLIAGAGDQGSVFPGIYKLEGDTFTLCRATATGDVERPMEFKATGEESVLMVWKRAKQ
jgi:clostripain